MRLALLADMERRRSTFDGGLLRRRLGTLTGQAARALGTLARRLGTESGLDATPVSAAMLTRVDTVSPLQTLEDAASLFIKGRQSFLPIVLDGQAAGVVTKDDVANGLRMVGPHGVVSQAPHHDALTVTPSESLSDVLEKLRASPDCVAVVVDDGVPVGLLTFDSVQQYLDRKRAA